MNHIYKVVFCKATGTFVAVTEYARAQGKSGSGAVGSSVGTSGGKFGKGLVLTAMSSAVALASSTAFGAVAINSTGNGAFGNATVSSNGANAGSTGIAIGKSTNAQADNAISIGNNARVDQFGHLAMGTNASVLTPRAGQNGAPSNLRHNPVNSHDQTKTLSSVAIGFRATARGEMGDVIIGAQASNDFGRYVDAGTNKRAISQSTAIGSRAFVMGDQASALGSDSNAIGNSSLAIGGDDVDTAINALSRAIPGRDFSRFETLLPHIKGDTAEGKKIRNLLNSESAHSGDLTIARADDYGTRYVRTSAVGDASIAMGPAAQTLGVASMAVGVNALAFDTAGIAQGVLSRAHGANATAVGSVSYADGLSTVAVGHDAQSLSDTSTSVGAHSVAGTKEQSPRLNHTQKEIAKVIATLNNASNHGQLVQQLEGLRGKNYLDTDTKGELARLTNELKTGGRLAGGDYNGIAAARDEVKNRLEQLSQATTSTRATAVGIDASATVGGGIAVGSNANAGKIAFTKEQKVVMNKLHDQLKNVADTQYGAQLQTAYNGLSPEEKGLVGGVITDLYALYYGGNDTSNNAQKKAKAQAIFKSETYNLGADNIAVGTRAQSINHDAIAIGTDSYASGKQSVVIGERATSAYNTKTKENINGSHDVRGVVVIGAGAKHLGKSVGNNHLLRGNPANPLFTEGANFVHAGLGEIVATHTSDKGTKTLKFENNLLGADNTQYPTVATVVGRHAAGGGGSTVVGDTAYSAGTGVAVGSLAYVEGTSGISVGPGAYTGGNTAIAIGRQAATKQGADFATSIGAMSAATGFSSFAIGHSATSEGLGSIAIGSANFLKADSTTGTEGVQFGTKYIENGHHTQASKMHSVAFGTVAEATEHGAMAFGAYSGATKELALATGYRAQATGKYATAQGEGALASNEEAYAAGSNTHATGKQSTAVGNTAVAAQQGAIAIGSQALAGMGDKAKITDIANKEEALRTAETDLITAEKDFEAKLFAQQAADIAYKKKKILQNSEEATAEKSALDAASAAYNTAKTELENKRTAYKAAKEAFDNATKLATTVETGKNAIAIGTGAVASNDNSISIGTGNVVTGKNSGAIGDPSYITGEGTYTIGNDNGTANAPISAKNAGAFGNNNALTGEGSRIIGNSNNVSGKNSQVFGNNTKVGADDVVVIGNNINTTIQGRADNTVNGAVILGNNSAPVVASTVNSATVNGIKYEGFAGNTNLTNGSIVSVGSATAARQIKHVAPGEISATSTDAINGSQLYLTQDRLGNVASSTATNLGGNVTVGQDGKLTQPTYNIYKGKDTPNQAGNGTAQVTGAPAKNVGDAITALNTYINQGFKVNDNAGTTKGVVTPGEAVQFADGQATKSVVATEANGVTKVQYDVQVDGTTIVIDNGKLKANTSGAPQTTDLVVNDGKVNNPANADENKLTKAGNIADTINQSGFKVAQNGTAQLDLINPGDTLDFIDGANTKVTLNTTPNGNMTVKVDVKSDGVLTPEGATTTPTGKITTTTPTELVTAQTVANAINEAGFNVIGAGNKAGANDFSKQLVKAGDTVTLEAGKNLTVAQDGNKFTFATKDDVEFNNVTVGPVVINKDAGINAGNKPITNVGKGNNPTDAANVGQLTKVEQGQGTRVTSRVGTNGETIYKVEATAIPASVATGNLTVNDGTTPAKPKGTISGDGNTDQHLTTSDGVADAINKAGFNITGESGTTNPELVNAGDTVNFKNGKGTKATVDGLNVTYDVNTINAPTVTTTGSVDKPATGGDDSFLTTNQVIDAINNSGFNVIAAKTGKGTNSGTAPAKALVKTGEEVKFTAGDGIDIMQNDKEFVFKANVDGTTIKVNDDGKLEAIAQPATGGGKFKVAGNDGNTTKTVSPAANAADAPTLQVKGEGPVKTEISGDDTAPVITVKVDKANVPVANNDGKLENPTTNPTGLVDGETLVSAINAAAHKVATADDETYIESGENQAGVAIKAGDKVTYKAGKNINVKQTDKEIAFGLNKDIAVDSVTLGNTPNATKLTSTPDGDLKVGKGANGTDPAQITNVAGNLDGAKTGTNAPVTATTKAPQDYDGVKNNAATVGDVLNAGFNLKHSNGTTTTDKDFVRHADNVIFADGKATKASVVTSADGKTSTIKYDVEIDDSTLKINQDGKLYAVVPPAQGAGKFKVAGNDGTTTKTVTPSAQDNDAPTLKVEGEGPVKTTVSGTDTAPVITVSVDKAGVPDVNSTTNKGKLENPTNPTGLVDGNTLVSAVNKAGFAVNANNNPTDFGGADKLVNAGESLNFVNGVGTTAKVTADGITFDVAKETAPTVNNNGQVNTPAVGDKFLTAKDTIDAINNSGFTVNSGKIGSGTNTGGTPASTLVKTGEEVKFIAGNGINIAQNGKEFTIANGLEFKSGDDTTTTVTHNGNTVTITAKIPPAGTAPKQEDVGFTVSDGTNTGVVVTKKDNSPTITVKGKDKAPISTNVKVENNNPVVEIDVVKADAPTVNSTNEKGKLENPTTNPTGLVDGTTLVNAVNSAGFTLAVSEDGGKLEGTSADTLITAGKKVDLAAGKNIKVKQNADGKVTFATQDDVEFNKVTSNTIVVPTNPAAPTNSPITINQDGISAGNKPITNVADGVGDKDAVNVSQLKAAKETVVAGDSNVAVDNTGTNADGGKEFKVKLNPVVTIGGAPTGGTAANNPVTINGEEGHIRGLTNTTFDPNATYNNKQAATEEQLKAAYDAVGFKLTTEAAGGTANTPTLADVKNGNTVTIKAGKGITTKQDGTSITIEASTQPANVGLGDVTVNNDGKATGNGNDADHLTSADDVADAINKAGFKVAENGAAKPDLVNAGDMVDFKDGDNTTVKVDTTPEGTVIKVNVKSDGRLTPETSTTAPANPTGKITTTTPTELVTAQTVANAINEAGFNVNSGAVNGGTNTGNASTLVKTGEEVKFIADNGVSITQAGKDFSFGVNVDNSTIKIVNGKLQAISAAPATTTLTVEAVGNVAAPSAVAPTNGVADANKFVKAGDLATTLNTTGFAIKANNADTTYGGNDKLVNAGENLNFIDGVGTKVAVSDTGITFNVNKADAPNVTNGKIDTPTAGDTFLTAKDTVDAINSAAWQLEAKADGGTVSGTPQATNVSAGNKVELIAGKNIDINQNGKALKISAKDPKFKNSTTVTVVQDPDGTYSFNATTGAGPAPAKPSGWKVSDKDNNIENVGTVDVDAPTLKVQGKDGSPVSAKVTKEGNTPVVEIDVKTADVTVENGKVKDPEVADKGKLVTADTLKNVVNNVAHKVATKASDEVIDNDSANEAGVDIKAGDKVTYIAGKNIKVKQDGGDVTFALAKDVNLGGNGSLTLGDNANPITINKDGIKAGDKQITNIAKGADVYAVGDALVNEQPKVAGLTKFESPNVADGNAMTVADAKNMGWVLSAADNNGQPYAEQVKNANEVNFVGSGAAKVTGATNGNKRTITVHVDPASVENTTLAVADGKVTTPSTTAPTTGGIADANKYVNAGDLTTTLNTIGFGVQANGNPTDFGGADKLVNAGESLNFVNGVGTTAKVTADGITFDVAKETAPTVNNNGQVNTPAAGDKFLTAKDTIDAINNSGFTVNSGATGSGVNTGNASTLVKTGEEVKFIAGNGINIAQNGKEFTIANGIEFENSNTVTVSKKGGKYVFNAIGGGTGTAPAKPSGWVVKDKAGATQDVGEVPANNAPVLQIQGKDGSPVSAKVTKEGNTPVVEIDVVKADAPTVNNANEKGKLENPSTNPTGLVDGTTLVNSVNSAGFGVQVNGNDTEVGGADKLVNAGDKVNFVDGQSTTAKSNNGNITFNVNAQDVVNRSQLPVVYTKADGTKVAKADDGNFYEVKADGTPDKAKKVEAGDVIASMNTAGNQTTTPMKLANVGSSIDGQTVSGVAAPTFKQKLDAAAADNNSKNNAVNVSDLKGLADTGLNFADDNGTAINRPLGSTLNIKGGETVTGIPASKNISVTANGDTLELKLAKDINLGNEGSLTLGDNANPITINKDGIKAGDKAITNVAGNLDGAKTGTTAPTTVATKAPQDYDGVKNNAATVGDVLNAGFNLKHSNGTTITDKDFVRHADNVIFADGNATTATIDTDGTTSTIKYDVKVDNDTIKIDNGVLKATATKPETTTLNVTGGKVDAPSTTAPTTGGTAEGDKFVTAANLADTINQVGFDVAGNDGTTVQQINAGEKVSFKDGQSTTAKVTADGDNVNVSFDVNAQDVVNRSQLPVVYTTADGKKVAKADDGNFYEAKADGTPDKAKKVEAGDVIASMNTAGNQTTTPMKLANVGSSIANQTGNNFAEKLDNANTNAPNNAVNVSDLKGLADTGLNFKGDNGVTVNRPLGSVLDVKGGADVAKLTENNIGVVANAADGSLSVKLAENINLGDNGSLKIGGNNPITINKDGINAGNKQITNIAKGADVYKTGDMVHGQPIAKQPKFEGLTNLEAANAGNALTVADAKNMGWVVSAHTLDNNGNKVNPYADQVTNAREVQFIGKNGTTVKGETTADGVRTITIESVQRVIGSNSVKGKDGIKVTAADKTDSSGNVITDSSGNPVKEFTVSADTIGLTTSNGKVDTPTTLQGLVDAENIAKAINETGFVAKNGDNDNGQLIKAGDPLNLVAGKNTKVTRDGNTFTFATKDDVSFNNVKVGDVVINKDTGINAGNKKITGVQEGSDDTDAVNVKQLKDVGFKLATAADGGTATGATTVDVKNGNTVTIKAGKGITTTQNGRDVTISADISKGSVGLNNNGTVNATNADGSNATAGNAGDVATVGDVANAVNNSFWTLSDANGTTTAPIKAGNTVKFVDGQGTKASVSYTNNEPKVTFDVATANLNVNGGKVNTPAAGNVFATATDVANAINNTGFTAKANGDSGEFIKAGDSVNFAQGDNINITRNGSNFTVATKSDVKFSSVQLGDGPKLSNNGGNLKVGDVNGQPVRITNVAAGVDDNDVVNVSQLNAAKTKVVAGRNVESVVHDAATNTYTVNVKDTAIVRANVGVVNAKADGTVEQNAGNQAGDAVSASSIVDAVNASGWNISGNGNNKELVNPGDQVDFVNGKGTNVSVTTAGNKTTVKVDSPMAYVNANAADESTPSDTVKMVGDNPVQVQNIASGVRPAGGGATPTGAARVKAINEATGDTLNNAVNVGDLQAVAKASVTKVTSNDGSIEVVKSQDADTGATSYDVSVATTTLDVATGSTATATGKVEAPSTANANKFVKAGDLANTLNNMGFTVKANNETAGDKVSVGDVVTFKEGDNIKVERTGTTFTIKTSDNINVKGDLNVDGKTKVGDLTVKPNSTVDMGGNAVTNVKANLVDSSNATATPNENTPANLATKKDNAATVGDVLNAGWGLQNNGTDKDVVRHADKVNFVNGVGTTIKVETNADKTVNTIKVDSPLAYVNKDASGNITTDQSTPSNTVSLVGQGNNPVVVTNVADGRVAPDSKEAVNGSQLYQAYQVLGGNSSNITTINPTAPTQPGNSGTINNGGNTINVTNNNVTNVPTSNNYTMVTYNVEGQKNYITNNVIEAIGRINEQGIQFFHTNDGTGRARAIQGENDVDSSASGAYSTAIGRRAEAAGENAVAMGHNAKALGKDSIAIGKGNIVTGKGSGAIGDPSVVSGDDSYTYGNDNKVMTDKTFVIGSNVTATKENSIFLGDSASYSYVTGTDSTKIAAAQTAATTLHDANLAESEAVAKLDVAKNAVAGLQASNASAADIAKANQDLAAAQAAYTTAQAEKADAKTKAEAALKDVSDNEAAQIKANIASNTGRTAGASKELTKQNLAGKDRQFAGGDQVVGVVSVGSDTETRRIQNVAPGLISAQSTDAINGSQLYALAEKHDTDLSGVWNSINGNAAGIASNAAGIAANAANIAQGVVVGDGVNTKRFGLGSPINVLGDANVTTVLGDDGLHIGLSPDINVNSITIPNQNGGAPVQITQNGLDNGGNPITNVGDGTQPHHAVNLGQLERGLGKVENGANAGTSSAMAMAALPQAYIPGKSMLTGGAATYNGQGAVAVGLSKLSDNGRWVLKVSGSADTQGNVGGSVGAGFHF